ncbi:MAG: hypothetical protein IJS45_08275 [Clostridia bacterium]|nr:hypothetical protein [Clostridia bacterium]
MDYEYLKRKLGESRDYKLLLTSEDGGGNNNYSVDFLYKKAIVISFSYIDNIAIINLYTRYGRNLEKLFTVFNKKAVGFVPLQFAVRYMEDKEKLRVYFKESSEYEKEKDFTFVSAEDAWTCFERSTTILDKIVEDKKLPEIINELKTLVKEAKRK